MKILFDPVTLKGLSMKNRLVRSATWEGIAAPDGSLTEEAYSIYRELAAGGVGLVITGFTNVSLHDYYFDGMMRLCDDALIPQYKKLTDLPNRMARDPGTVSKCISCNRCYSSPSHRCIFRKGSLS